ncbi:HEPN domain-containing protein [Promicromonospora panici]|uniref:ApeA N-terminal domain 1-containing protein n=1 Tax=Promicromonospora panici TaxID=2219658 RepID=UPI00101C2784|nr:HEPN domain-containing protein [Promicromonospora panici]
MTDRNLLEPGASRLGNLYDEDPDTPQPRALLEHADDAPRLSVFWDEHGASVEKWFSGHVRWGDDPDRTKFRYDVPKYLHFRDHYGDVALVGCRSGRSDSELVSGMGRGYIHPTYTVLDRMKAADYERPYGLRSTMSGLRDWVGVQSIHQGQTVKADGLISAVSYALESPPDIPVTDVEGLVLVPSWGVRFEEPDTTLLDERMYIQTWFSEQRTWDDHLVLHRAVRDLISLSRWRAEQITGLLARADANTAERAEDRPWSPTLAPGVIRPAPESTRWQHLISYDDVGVGGIAAWLRLRDAYHRAIDPVMSSLYLDTPVESRVSQVGIGLEALGYLLAIDREGKSKRVAKDMTYTDRFTLVAGPLDEVLPFDTATWAEEFANAYNAVKHVNRDLPDVIDMLNLWRESTLVFRVWAAAELGVDMKVLAQRVEADHQIHPFVRQ